VHIAFVCRDLAHSRLTGPGARTFSTASAMASAGHDVHLISDGLASHRARALAARHGPQWTRVRETRPQHRYFTDQHAYADRVYDTLHKLSRDEPFDVIEFSSTVGEALTCVRAKRLLDEFAGTVLLVRMGTELEAANSDGHGRRPTPLTLDRWINDFAHDYISAHCDALLADVAPTHAELQPDDEVRRSSERARVLIAPLVPAPLGIPALRIPEVGAVLTIWHLGELTPHSGIDTFLDAAQLVLDQEPRARFVIAGDDTRSDPFGRSYWEFCTRRISAELAAAVTYSGPLADARETLPKAGNQCVIATATADAAGGVVLAMAQGCVVTVRDKSAAAAFVEKDISASIIAATDETALAATMLRVIHSPALASTLSRGATLRSATHYQPGEIATALTEIYDAERSQPTLPPPAAGNDVVSVVIPLYNQGHYIASAIESVRASAYPHIEIVVVDDGSSDAETIAIFDALEGVTKVRQANAGLSAARNAGIAAAVGRYILPLDSDDLVADGFIAAGVTALERNPELGYVAGNLKYFGMLDHTHVPAGYIPHLSLVVNTHVRATALFRRDALTTVGGYDVALPAFEDWDLHIRLALAGYDSDILPVDCHLYRRHDESMTFSSSNAMRLELLQHLMAKHLASIDHTDVAALLLLMAQLWKSGYEPSASVRLQQERQTVVLPDTAVSDVTADWPVGAP
jgi:glycosyltransferase involved in cell wall biosynthesis